jgi:hypothetical protein
MTTLISPAKPSPNHDMKDKRWFSFLLLLGFLGCASTTPPRQPPTDEQLAKLAAGSTTFDQMVGLFGQPSTQKPTDAGIEAEWRWGSSGSADLQSHIPVIGPVIGQRSRSSWSEVLKIQFDKKNVARDIQHDTDFRPNLQ